MERSILTAPSFTAREPTLRQIADTSLSCLHSNTDPITLLDVKEDGSIVVASTSLLRRSNHYSASDLRGRVPTRSVERRASRALANDCRDRAASCDELTDVV